MNGTIMGRSPTGGRYGPADDTGLKSEALVEWTPTISRRC
jgi:hypothetical protein